MHAAHVLGVANATGLFPIRNAFRVRTLEMHLQRLPAVSVVVLLHLLTGLQTPFRHPDDQATFKHECHAAGAHLLGRQRDGGCLLEALHIRSVAGHGVVKTGPRRLEATLAAALGIVVAHNQAHELGHGVPMVPRGTEGIFGHQPARGEDDKVGHCGAVAVRGRGRREYGEDAGIGMIVRNAADGHEPAEIVFVRIIVAMPRHHVEGGVTLGGFEQVAAKFAIEVPFGVLVIFKKIGDGRLEVTRVGQAKRTKRAQFGKLEMPFEEFEDVPTHRLLVGQFDVIANPPRYHTDLVRPNQNVTQFSPNVEHTVLRDDEKIAIGTIEGRFLRHRRAGRVNVDAYSLFHSRIPGARHQIQ